MAAKRAAKRAAKPAAKPAAKKEAPAKAPAAPKPRTKHKVRKVASMAAHHVLRGNDGDIVARVCVEPDHIFYALADAKVWRRVTLKEFAAFMEAKGEHVKSWDGGD